MVRRPHPDYPFLSTTSFNPSLAGCWMVRIVDQATEHHVLERFNPSLAGCWMVRSVYNRIQDKRWMFQSFFGWMLNGKWCAVVVSVSNWLCFNPSLAGCWMVSLALIGEHQSQRKFQSFFGWMLNGKLLSFFVHKTLPLVSILLWLDAEW